MKRIAIVGGGISGLACAHTLAKSNADFILYEMNYELGGRIKEFAAGGSYVSLGAKTISANYTRFIGLIREMGLGHRIVRSHETMGIFTKHRLIRVTPFSILFDGTISFRTKLDLLKFKRYLNSLATDSMGGDLAKTSLRDFVLQRYSEGVLKEFVEPLARAFFAEDPANISALSGLQVISGAFEKYELDGGYYPLVRTIESRLEGRVVKGKRVERVVAKPDGRFALKWDGNSAEADSVVCCVPVPELERMVEGISYPEVNYVSKMAYAIEGESRYPRVGELVNGDPEYRTDIIHYRGRLATLSSVREDPDLTAFFKSAKVLVAHKWPYCSPRSKPGAQQPRFETEIPNLYKAGDLIYGGGLEASTRSGIEVARLVLRSLVTG